MVSESLRDDPSLRPFSPLVKIAVRQYITSGSSSSFAITIILLPPPFEHTFPSIWTSNFNFGATAKPPDLTREVLYRPGEKFMDLFREVATAPALDQSQRLTWQKPLKNGP